MYVDVDYVNKDNGRCSVSGAAVMVGGIVVDASRTTQHYVTLSTRDAGGLNSAIHEDRV